MNRSFSIIIVTWNAIDHLKSFLQSVVNSDYENFEILIADNGSTDRSIEWVHETYPDCNTVRFTKNYGYCGGNNRASDHSNGDILVFLNNDVMVESDWLQHLNKMFDDPETAIVQPKIRSYTDPEKFEYAGAAGGYLDQFGYPFCRGRIFDNVEQDYQQYDNPANLFWASGAALAIRKDIFDNLGRFDEHFQFHMEEIDLCWRCLNSNYSVRYCPESVVYHLGGGSLPSESSRKTYYNYRNNLQMLWKNATSDWLKKRFFIRLCLDAVAGIYAIFKRKPGDTIAIIRAHFYFYFTWNRTHKKRKIVQSQRQTVSEPEEMLPVSIVYQYYLRKKRTFSDLFKK